MAGGTGQVRSLTLDVKVWKPHVVALMAELGNSIANTVWEEAKPRGPVADSWVWCDDSDEDLPVTPQCATPSHCAMPLLRMKRVD